MTIMIYREHAQVEKEDMLLRTLPSSGKQQLHMSTFRFFQRTKIAEALESHPWINSQVNSTYRDLWGS